MMSTKIQAPVFLLLNHTFHFSDHPIVHGAHAGIPIIISTLNTKKEQMERDKKDSSPLSQSPLNSLAIILTLMLHLPKFNHKAMCFPQWLR